METPLAPPAKSGGSLRAFLLLAAIFVLGLVIGAGGMLIGVREMTRRAVTARPADVDRQVATRLAVIEDRVNQRLDLTPDERQMVHDELEISGNDFKADRQMFLAEVREIARNTVFRISNRLPPEKAGRLRILAERRLAYWGIDLKSTPPFPPPAPPPAGG